MATNYVDLSFLVSLFLFKHFMYSDFIFKNFQSILFAVSLSCSSCPCSVFKGFFFTFVVLSIWFSFCDRFYFFFPLPDHISSNSVSCHVSSQLLHLCSEVLFLWRRSLHYHYFCVFIRFFLCCRTRAFLYKRFQLLLLFLLPLSFFFFLLVVPYSLVITSLSSQSSLS